MIIGIDIGGTKTRLASSSFGTKIERSQDIVTPQNQRKVVSSLIEIIRSLASGQHIDAIGIACPGPLDKARGMVLSPRNLKWHNLKLVAPLKEEFGAPVNLEHDATCGAVAEARIGAGKKHRLVLYVTISTGIGTGIALDGRPLPSVYNSEGGQQIIDPSYQHNHHRLGSYENLASGSAIVRRYGNIAAQIHDKSSWELIGYEISIGLHNLITIVAPDVVILGGGVSVHYHKFAKSLKSNLERWQPLYPTPPIVRADYVETAPLLGAMLLAAENA